VVVADTVLDVEESPGTGRLRVVGEDVVHPVS
jgi:hypothetical protein